MGFIVGLIVGLIVGIIIMCIIQGGKNQRYEDNIDGLLQDNMELMMEINKMKHKRKEKENGDI